MHTLLLRIAGPLQSWGSSSQFDTRDTELEPTRSGVIGMIAGAFGLDRGEDLSCFDDLGFGVRIEQPGEVIRDYHTVYTKSDYGEMASKDKVATKVTNRFYLADAVFVVGIDSSDISFLESIADALDRPYYAPYLGRRSCPPTGKLVLGIVEGSVEQVLRNVEWHASDWYKQKKIKERQDIHLSLVLERADGAYRRRDYPMSFGVNKREYRYRNIEYLMGKGAGVLVYTAPKADKVGVPEEHDPMAGL